MIVTAGKTNVSVYYYIVGDAGHATPGEPVTGLLFSDIETGGSASYVRQGAARVDLTLKTLASASAAHDDGGFILVDDTNQPGVYRCDYADATFATGVDQAILSIVVASANNAVAAPILVDIFDIDVRDSVRGGMTSLPNAAADAVGGLPISDAGGLDLDTKLANTNEITVARMGALTDWLNGGRLDLLLDAIPTTAMRGTDSAALASVCTEARLAELDAANIPADIDAIPTTAMRGTDSAALASVCTEARLAELDAGNLPTDIAAIPTTAMRGTDSAALASVCTEARLAELDAGNLPTDIAAIPTTAMRGTDSAALASVCTEARLAELDAANIPADLDAVLVDTGTTLPALIDDLAVKKNATFSNFEFLMVLTSDHVTPATGLTVTGQRSIDGGAFAGVGGTIAEVSNGIYQFDALAADTNGDVITWRFSSATADDTFVTFKTVA